MIDWILVGQVGAGLAGVWLLSLILLPARPRWSIRVFRRQRQPRPSHQPRTGYRRLEDE